jgi:hypothetical protein
MQTQKRVGIFESTFDIVAVIHEAVMSQLDFQSLIDYAKSYSYAFLAKTSSHGYTLGQDYVFPTLRKLLSSHPDITSLFLLLITLYISILVLNTASRWMYSFIMSIVRMVFLAALVLGAVWVIKVGQGENGSETAAGGVQWVMDKGKRYVWNAAGEMLNR